MPQPALVNFDATNAPHILEQHLDKHGRKEQQGDDTADDHQDGGSLQVHPRHDADTTDVEAGKQPDGPSYECKRFGLHFLLFFAILLFLRENIMGPPSGLDRPFGLRDFAKVSIILDLQTTQDGKHLHVREKHNVTRL